MLVWDAKTPSQKRKFAPTGEYDGRLSLTGSQVYAAELPCSWYFRSVAEHDYFTFMDAVVLRRLFYSMRLFGCDLQRRKTVRLLTFSLF
jgi:hypothetical protein